MRRIGWIRYYEALERLAKIDGRPIESEQEKEQVPKKEYGEMIKYETDEEYFAAMRCDEILD